MRRALFVFLLLLLAHGRAGAGELKWGHLTLAASAPVDSVAWFRALDLEGRPVAGNSLEDALDRALHELARGGHPFAEAHPKGFALEGDRIRGTIVVDPGPRAHVEALELTGARVTQPKTALRMSGVKEGNTYTGEDDERVTERLSRSGLFTHVGSVEVVPGTSPDAVRLRVPVEESPYTRFRGLVGMGKDAKVTGLLDIDLANIAGTARSATGRWENRGEGLTRYALRYREPWLPVIGIGLEGSLEHDVNENLYSYTKWEAIGDLLLGDQWTLRFGRGGSRAVETIEGASPVTEGYFLAGIDLDRRNSARNPDHGYRLTGESRRGTKTFTPDSVEARIDRTHWLVAGETYQPVGRKWLGVLRGRFEFLQTPEDSVPRWDEIAVGGANSLRGYREDQFLTLGATVLQGEWRLRQDSRGSAVYAFADAGFIQEDGHRLNDLFDQFLLGAGLGIRQAKGPGILSLEYGIPKGSSPLEGRLHLRLDAVF